MCMQLRIYLCVKHISLTTSECKSYNVLNEKTPTLQKTITNTPPFPQYVVNLRFFYSGAYVLMAFNWHISYGFLIGDEQEMFRHMPNVFGKFLFLVLIACLKLLIEHHLKSLHSCIYTLTKYHFPPVSQWLGLLT